MQVEYSVQGHKAVSSLRDPGPLPPLRVAAVSIKTVPDGKDKAQEIVGISVLHMTVPMDRPLDMNAWQRAQNIRRLSIVCPTSGSGTRVPSAFELSGTPDWSFILPLCQ